MHNSVQTISTLPNTFCCVYTHWPTPGHSRRSARSALTPQATRRKRGRSMEALRPRSYCRSARTRFRSLRSEASRSSSLACGRNGFAGCPPSCVHRCCSPPLSLRVPRLCNLGGRDTRSAEASFSYLSEGDAGSGNAADASRTCDGVPRLATMASGCLCSPRGEGRPVRCSRALR